jgi:hypothetical protein
MSSDGDHGDRGCSRDPRRRPNRVDKWHSLLFREKRILARVPVLCDRHLPAAELLAALNVSRATLMRAVCAAGPEVLTIGASAPHLLCGPPAPARQRCAPAWTEGAARLLQRGLQGSPPVELL